MRHHQIQKISSIPINLSPNTENNMNLWSNRILDSEIVLKIILSMIKALKNALLVLILIHISIFSVENVKIVVDNSTIRRIILAILKKLMLVPLWKGWLWILFEKMNKMQKVMTSIVCLFFNLLSKWWTY